MLLLLLCFALAYCIHGAATQAFTDGRAAVGKGRTWAGTKVATIRENGSPYARAGLGLGTALAGVGKGLWWATTGTGRSLYAGGTSGWGRGRARGVRAWARLRTRWRRRRTDRRRQREAHPPQAPGWRHHLTGECPVCHHLPGEAAVGVKGCRCDASAQEWPCACARRHRHTAPLCVCGHTGVLAVAGCPCDRVGCACHDNPDNQFPGPPAGGDGPAASADPAQPQPVDSTPNQPAHDPTPDPTPAPPKENPMPITGEATDLDSALIVIEQIEAQATTHLDTAAAAVQEAAEQQAAVEVLQAKLAAAGMDEASLTAVARLAEQVQAMRDNAEQVRTIADAAVAAAQGSHAEIKKWQAVQEQMRALGASPDSQFIAPTNGVHAPQPYSPAA